MSIVDVIIEITIASDNGDFTIIRSLRLVSDNYLQCYRDGTRSLCNHTILAKWYCGVGESLGKVTSKDVTEIFKRSSL